MFEKQRIGEIISQLSTLRYPKHHKLTNWQMRKQNGESRPYPNDNADDWHIVTDGEIWGGHCDFYAFRGCVEIPEGFENQCIEFSLLTGREEQWDATNPQFSVYINGQLRQGFDTNHHDIVLSQCATPQEQFDIFLSAFTGTQNFHLQFRPELRILDKKVEQLYSIYPHTGTWKEAGTVQRAYLLNNPFKAYISKNGAGELPDNYAMISHAHRNIMVESVKKAEDSNTWVYRLYEFENSRTRAKLQLPAKAKNIWLCNMLESPEKHLGADTSDVSVLMEPFAIETIMVEF